MPSFGCNVIDGLLLQVRLAKRLVEQSFADKVFYANSGTEANEAAIKFARKYARVHGEPSAPRNLSSKFMHDHELLGQPWSETWWITPTQHCLCIRFEIELLAPI